MQTEKVSITNLNMGVVDFFRLKHGKKLRYSL